MPKKGNYAYTNIVRNTPIEDIQKQLDTCSKLSEILRNLKIESSGRSREVLLSVIQENNLSMDKFRENIQKRREITPYYKKISNIEIQRRPPNLPLTEYLVIGNNILPGSVKKRLFREGVLEDKCSCCGMLPIWNNKPLKLQVDHSNGNPKDNRIENLRVLCPNCHSQTATWGGRNITKK
jgi:hypothetical protein